MTALVKRLLKLLVGGLFIYLGVKNLYPIESFEYRLIEQNLAGWISAPLLARLLISLQFAAGLLLVLGDRINRAGALLIIPLFISLFDLGWSFIVSDRIIMDCPGCFFGSTWISLLIYALVFGVFWSLMWFQDTVRLPRKWMVYPAILLALPWPFILNPVYPNQFTDGTEALDISLQAWQSEYEVSNLTINEIDTNAQLIGLFSAGCPHCRLAAQKMAVARQTVPGLPPFKAFFLGDREGVDYFFELSHTEHEHLIVEDPEEIFRMAHNSFPAFVLVKNGKVTRKWNARQFNYGVMVRDWKN